MANRAFLFILFELCFAIVISQSDVSTTLPEESSPSSDISKNFAQTASSSTPAKVGEEVEEEKEGTDPPATLAVAADESQNSAKLVSTSTFPPLVHNNDPHDSEPSAEPSNIPPQAPPKSAEIPEEKPATTMKINAPDEAKTIPTTTTTTQKPNSSNLLQANLLILSSMILVWKFCFY